MLFVIKEPHTAVVREYIHEFLDLLNADRGTRFEQPSTRVDQERWCCTHLDLQDDDGEPKSVTSKRRRTRRFGFGPHGI